MEHLAFHVLVDYTLDELPTKERAVVAAHLEKCAACRAELAIARQLSGSLSIKPAEPPRSLLDRAAAAFRRRQRAAVERITSSPVLHFDSLTDRTVGARGASTERQLLYQAGEFDIDLRIARELEAEQFTLHGQILAEERAQSSSVEPSILPDVEDFAGIELRLRNQIDERRGLTDRLGRFRFSNLQTGPYALQIRLDEQDFVIEPIDIAPPI